MTASTLISRAKSLADLQSTDFITYQDKLNSLNESYRDVYSAITEANDDYFLQEEILSVSPVPNGNSFEYQVPLPDDFFQVRYIDFSTQGVWQPVNKFPLSARDINPGQPYYRFKDRNLWILGNITGDIRLGYYPKREILSLPDDPLTFLSTLPAYDGTRITPSSYTNNTLIYIEAPGTNYIIKAQNLSTGVTSTLYTSATAISNVVYYKGYIYFIDNTGNIKRGTTDLLGTLTPANIIATANVASFTVYKDNVYFATGTETRICGLDGTGSTQIAAEVRTSYYSPYYVHNGEIFNAGVASGITGVSRLSSDGVYLYTLKTTGDLVKYSLDYMDQWTLASGVKFIGPVTGDRIPVNVENVAFLGLSTAHDSDVSYPDNAIFEVISYQAAVDFRRKQNADTTALTQRLAALWSTFKDTIVRDEYQPERIRNYYMTSGGAYPFY